MSEQIVVRASSAALSGIKPKASPLPRDDLYKWAMEQSAHLRSGSLDQIDLLNVADEIESMGRSEYRSLVSGLEIILLHKLKWDHQPSKRSHSWVYSILEHRRRVENDLVDSPSLKSRIGEALDTAYGYARIRASSETTLFLSTFPDTCPYSWDQVMHMPYDLDRI